MAGGGTILLSACKMWEVYVQTRQNRTCTAPSILLSDGFRSLPERGFAAALTNLDAARSLRPCGLRGRAAQVMRRRTGRRETGDPLAENPHVENQHVVTVGVQRHTGRPGPSRRSDCAVGVRAFKSRSLPGCDSPQGRVAAPVRAPIARGLRPARACRATLARGPRASASFYPLALDHVLDPIERCVRPLWILGLFL